MNGDGRLDLDDLGGVIERASSIDQPVDVVGEESRRTWGERLEAAGITPWLRRHRVAVATGTAAVVVVGVGVTTWVRAQPPPWHEPAFEVVAATLDSGSGTGMRRGEDGTATAAYLVTTDDPGTTVQVAGLVGPGIRASTVGPALPTGNPKSTVVRAAFGCDDDALVAMPSDYRLRLTLTDAWGRGSTAFAGVPSDGDNWRDAVVQGCWTRSVLTEVRVDGVDIDVDEGAGAVNLRLDVSSELPGQVLATFDGSLGETAIVPTGVGTELPTGAATTVAGRLDVWDCSGGPPPIPTVFAAGDPANLQYYRSFEGVGLQVYAPDRNAWAIAPVEFTRAQSAELRRALAQVCAGAPRAAVADERVVRQVVDGGASTVSLTVVADLRVPAGRTAVVSITRDNSIGFPDPTASVWSPAPPGGGRVEATWTFACFSVPTPPALDVRFVDGVRATPLRIPLDQETLAPWVSDACPDLTADRLVEEGWTLP